MSCQRSGVITTSKYRLFSLPVIPPYHTYYNARGNPSLFIYRLTVRASLFVDVMLGILCTSGSGTRAACSRRTVGNLQLAYEIVRHNFQERTDKQAESKEKWLIPHYQPGYHLLICRSVDDGPGPKLCSPWHGPVLCMFTVSRRP